MPGMTREEETRIHLSELKARFEFAYGNYEHVLEWLDNGYFYNLTGANGELLKKMVLKHKKGLVKGLLSAIKETAMDPNSLDVFSSKTLVKIIQDVLMPLDLGWKELPVMLGALIRNRIDEDLGNLSQLNAGPLINVLKQSGYYSSRNRSRYGSSASEIRNRFQPHDIGSTSEIVDIGVLKQGMKTLRKAFKDNESAKAFAVYIGGTAVMFGITNSYELAGSSRESLVAYDLTKWKDIIDQMYAGQYRKPSATTARSEEAPRYADDAGRQRHYSGTVMDTSNITAMFTVMQEISKQTGEPLTAKLVLSDVAAMSKRRGRINARDIQIGTKDLRTRLAYYKNSKKPTVGSVKEFIAMSLKNPGSKVQFAGITYHLKSSSYDKIDPTNLLKGIPFSVSYSSADPGVYDSLSIVYKFDTETNQLLPIKASFRDKSIDSYKTQEEILDPKLYLVHSLQTRKLGDKDTILPKILTMVKSQRNDEAERMMKALEMLGTDWPEIAMIKKSIAAQKQQS